MSNSINKRYEFVLLFDVENGNPNGDPDSGNMPRIDPETSHGIVTDVCIKRKIRNYVEFVKKDVPGFDIYVTEGDALNTKHLKAYMAFDLKSEPKKLPSKNEDAQKVIGFMCQNFYDIRTFGAVMTTEVNCGQVRGPVQINFARSIEPVIQQEVTITRVAVTNERDKEKKEHEMGHKYIIPYALYMVEGYVSALLAEKTGFTDEDLKLLWEALTNLFEHDRSAAHGKMATRKLIVFEHESKYGNAPAHKLFDAIKVEARDSSKPSRCFDDYKVNIMYDEIPQGVKLIEMV